MGRANNKNILVVDNTLDGKIVDSTGRADGDVIYWDNGTDTYKHHNVSPTISSGTSAPATTPTKVGDIFIDAVGLKLYFATGTSSSTDWTIAN